MERDLSPIQTRLRKLRMTAVTAIASCLACAPTSTPSPTTPNERATPPAPTTEAKPRLVVLLVVDQLPSWSFDVHRTLLEGGIGRLVRDGTYHRYGIYPYANTYTAPGHATLATGAPPSIHGILGNRWYDRDQQRVRSAVDDARAPSFALLAPDAPAQTTTRGVSGSALRVEGLADAWRRQTNARGRSVAVGLKERATALVLGQRPDLAIWYDEDAASMTTSRAYVETPPPWLVARADAIERRLDYTWEPLDPALLAATTKLPDDARGEGQAYGLDRSFPHALGETRAPAAALRLTPLGNEIVIDTALAAIEHERLGRDEVPDLLALTFSAHDYAGHLWGQESWERLDMFLRLDRQLGQFFDALDREVGEGQWAAVFTSDHGATPLVEHSISSGKRARRIPYQEVSATVDGVLDVMLRPHEWVVAVEASTVYLDAAFFAEAPERRREVLAAAAEAMRRIEGVRFAAVTGDLIGECDAREGDDALVCRGIEAERSGELFFSAAQYHLLADIKEIEGTAHGSINDEDRVVPIIVFDPRRPPSVVDGPVSMLRVAPTIAALLGGQPPAAASEPPL